MNTFHSNSYADAFWINWEDDLKARTKVRVGAFNVFGLPLEIEMTFQKLEKSTFDYACSGERSAIKIDDLPRQPIAVPLAFLQEFLAGRMIQQKIESLQDADRVEYYKEHVLKPYWNAR